MKFWYKTYLLTLLIFVFCLGGSMFFIGYSSQTKALESERGKMVSRHNLMGQTFARDLENTDLNAQRLEDIFRVYSSYYKERGIWLGFVSRHSGETIFSSLPFGPEIPDVQNDATVYSCFRQEGERHYLYLVSRLSNQFYFVSCTDQTEVFSGLEGDQRLYILVFCGTSLLLSVILFFMLKKLSQPVIRLAEVADQIAGGKLDARAHAQGKDEIAMLANSLNNMANSLLSKMEELERSAQQKERISDNLSHEIRTPLTAIQGYAEFIQLANLTERETREALQYIVKESQRLQKISSRMLQLSEMRRDEIVLAPTRLVPLVRNSAITIAARAAEKSVQFQLEKIPDVWVCCDEILMESLLNNLGDNAVKACEAGGLVQMKFACREEKMEITVQDNGSGMTEAQLQKLGEPFYRPEKARSRKAGGAGLGIALCCEIAKLHNTRLTYTSTKGVGTRVMFAVALAEKEVEKHEK